MNTRNLCFIVIAITGFLVFADKGNAATFPNPDPISYGDDIEDTGIFSHSNAVLNIELFDFGDSILGSTFGFFFEGTDVTNPANLFTIFDPTDTGPTLQEAVIDFTSGWIIDKDQGITQDTFAGAGNIGFFLTLHPSLGVPTLFSVPSLNLGNIDVVGTHPFFPIPDFFLLGFFPGTTSPFAYELIGPLTSSIQANPVALDIDPQHCPNKLKKKGGNGEGRADLKVVILGTQDFDVNTIDIGTIKLHGVAPVQWKFLDITAPSSLVLCDCEVLTKDTFLDLELKFDSQSILASLGTVHEGDMKTVILTGNLLQSAGGTAIEGRDCVLIIDRNE